MDESLEPLARPPLLVEELIHAASVPLIGRGLHCCRICCHPVPISEDGVKHTTKCPLGKLIGLLMLLFFLASSVTAVPCVEDEITFYQIDGRITLDQAIAMVNWCVPEVLGATDYLWEVKEARNEWLEAGTSTENFITLAFEPGKLYRIRATAIFNSASSQPGVAQRFVVHWSWHHLADADDFWVDPADFNALRASGEQGGLRMNSFRAVFGRKVVDGLFQ